MRLNTAVHSINLTVGKTKTQYWTNFKLKSVTVLPMRTAQLTNSSLCPWHSQQRHLLPYGRFLFLYLLKQLIHCSDRLIMELSRDFDLCQRHATDRYKQTKQEQICSDMKKLLRFCGVSVKLRKSYSPHVGIFWRGRTLIVREPMMNNPKTSLLSSDADVSRPS